MSASLRQVAAVAEQFRPEWRHLAVLFDRSIERGADWETWIAIRADMDDEKRRARCCNGHHFEGCTDGGPGCCARCPINPRETP